MQTYIYIYIYYIYTYRHSFNSYMYMYIYILTYKYILTYIYIQIFLHINVYKFTRVYIYICVNLYTLYIYICRYIGYMFATIKNMDTFRSDCKSTYTFLLDTNAWNIFFIQWHVLTTETFIFTVLWWTDLKQEATTHFLCSFFRLYKTSFQQFW